MKTPSIDLVLRSLKSVRRRMVWQALLDAVVNMAFVGTGGLVVLAVVRRWGQRHEPWDGDLALWIAAACAVIALLWALMRFPRIDRVARWLDRAGATRDRFQTALHFSRAEDAGPMRALALRECEAFVRGADFGKVSRVRFPAKARWLIAPIVALAMIDWESKLTLARLRAEAEAARAAVEETARQLEQLARKTAKAGEDAKSEDLQKLAAELRERAEHLRAEARNPEDAQKAALREISALEQLVRDMQKQPFASQELQELAKALAQNEPTKQAANALASGDLAKAAEELEKSLRDLQDRKDDRTPDEVKQALENAMKHLADQQKLSEQMQRVAQQMQHAAGGSEAMQKLAQALRQMAKSRQAQAQSQSQSGKSGRALTEQEAKNLLNALENMKFGEGQQDGSQPDAGGDGKGSIEIFNPSSGAPPGENDGKLAATGKPGSEKDSGTTEPPFGDTQTSGAKDPRAQQLGGRLGEGETLHQFLTSAGDRSKSARRYKELYEAMAPAAEEAVVQENIPLGSRFFIKRYFESIRPAE